jgi:hypothetical protein
MRGLAGLFLAGVMILGVAGCATKSTIGETPVSPVTPPTENAVVEYQGTASVGDFLTVTIDHDAHTIVYSNLSNSTSGTATYVVSSDGSYEITDPSTNLVRAWEIPGYAIVFEANRTGRHGDTSSLIFAILKAPIHKTDLAGGAYNYMQFRTSSGGLELGAVDIDGSSNITANGYWPYGGSNNSASFHHTSFDASLISEDPGGNYLFGPDGDGHSYIFGTQGGFLAVDTPNGSIICLPQQPSKDFNPAWAGTYHAMLYRKTDARTEMGNIETGIVAILRGTLTVGASGEITVTSASGDTVVTTQLTPIADHPELVATGRLESDCRGLFTFTIEEAGRHQEVFVVFLDNALLFSSYGYDPTAVDHRYHYFYGVGLKEH